VAIRGDRAQAFEIRAASLLLGHEPLTVVDVKLLGRDQLVHHQLDDRRAELRRRERPATGSDGDVRDGE